MEDHPGICWYKHRWHLSLSSLRFEWGKCENWKNKIMVFLIDSSGRNKENRGRTAPKDNPHPTDQQILYTFELLCHRGMMDTQWFEAALRKQQSLVDHMIRSTSWSIIYNMKLYTQQYSVTSWNINNVASNVVVMLHYHDIILSFFNCFFKLVWVPFH